MGDVDPDHPCFIQAAHGRGFRFVAEIERVEPPDGPLQPTNGNSNLGPPTSVDGGNNIATAAEKEAAKPLTKTEPVKIAEWTRILRSKNGVDDFAKHISGPEDVSAIDSLINESLPPKLLRNALLVIERLAAGWDGRTIKRSESYEAVKHLCLASNRLDLRIAAKTLATFCTSASKPFLFGEIRNMEPAVLAATLAVWSNDDAGQSDQRCIPYWDDLPRWRDVITHQLLEWVPRKRR